MDLFSFSIIIILTLLEFTTCTTNSLYYSEHEVVKTSISCEDDFCDKVTLKIDAKDRKHELHLVKNNYLFSSAYKSFESNGRTDPNLFNCYYNLNKAESSKKWASISTCHRQLNGAFSDGDGKAFELKFDSDTHQTVLYDLSKFQGNSTCGVRDDIDPPPETESRQFQATGELPKLYIKLLLVNSYNLYSKYHNSSLEQLTAHDHRLINHLNSIFEPIRVHIILIGMETWKYKEEIATNIDKYDTVNQFGKYAADNYYKRYNYDVALLHWGNTFLEGINGIADLDVICQTSPIRRKGVVTALNGLLQIRPEVSVAMTMAHEIGHIIIIGLEHLDLAANPHCECTGHRLGVCIMSPAKDNSLTTWSECTKSNLRTIHGKGDTKCLLAKPFDPIHAQSICGNGVLEAGEQCDCDHGDTACRTCCEVMTCKLKSGSTCASGQCCASCKLKRQGSQCSSLETHPQCVMPTACDGTSPVCPLTVLLPDLTKCRDRSFDGNCFRGRCVSRGGHCLDTWGSLVRPFDESKYAYWNTEGDEYGHCGQDHKHMIPCAASDVLCGTSKCDVEDYLSNKRALGREAAKKGGLTWRFVPISQVKPVACTLTPTYYSSNFHLTPEGMSCGNDKICSNVKCVPVGCQENCNGQGRCVSGKCVCNSGFSGPFCTKPCPSNCNRHGFCKKDGTCDCLEGFIPPSCTTPKTIVTSTTRRTTTTTARRTTTTTRKTTTTTRKVRPGITTTTKKPIPPGITTTTTRQPPSQTTPSTSPGSTNSQSTNSIPVSPSDSPRTTEYREPPNSSSPIPPPQLADKTKIIAAVIGVILIVICILSCLCYSGQDSETVTISPVRKRPAIRRPSRMSFTEIS